jgi:glucose-fructose oxidoreductase
MVDISRRGIIGAGISAAIIPSISRAQSDKSVGLAVVGLGKLSQGQIIPGFRNCGNARLAALVSGHPEKARRIAAEQKLSTRAVYTYADFDRISSDPAIDVVYIVLPNFMHAEYTIRALKAGKHVLCEKPMATTIGDAERMIAAAKAANRQLMIAYRCHYEPLNLAAMRLLRSGHLGKSRLVVTDMGRQADPSDPSDAWRLDMMKSGGGALTDMGIYGVNGARYLLAEEPTQVQAWSQTDPNDPRFRDVVDFYSWQFRFPSGAVATGSTSFNYAATMSWHSFSEQGKMTADPGCFYSGNRLTLGGTKVATPQIREIDQFAREMDWMADIVHGRAPMVSSAEEGLQDMRLMNAIMESAAKGGATVATNFGFRRAVDPAAVVDVQA